jgi:hypothetical protein
VGYLLILIGKKTMSFSGHGLHYSPSTSDKLFTLPTEASPVLLIPAQQNRLRHVPMSPCLGVCSGYVLMCNPHDLLSRTNPDPSRDTARLTDTLAPSCHERPSGGLWRRAPPSTQFWAPCAGYLGHVVHEPYQKAFTRLLRDLTTAAQQPDASA